MSAFWQEKVDQELLNARKALEANLEGRSRVSARRAAGCAVKEYFRLFGNGDDTNNYYHLLLRFSEYPGLPEYIQAIARHLCQRVNENHSVPGQDNFINETEILIQYLAGQINQQNN